MINQRMHTIFRSSVNQFYVWIPPTQKIHFSDAEHTYDYSNPMNRNMHCSIWPIQLIWLACFFLIM